MIPYSIFTIEDDNDRHFMEYLFTQYHRLMYKTILSIVHDQWAADDVLQTTLVKLIHKVEELRMKDRDRLVNYIITASKHTALTYLRDTGRKQTFDLNEQMDFEDIENGQDGIERRLIKKDDLDALAKVWPQLDERSRYLLEAWYILGKSAEEIAAELAIKPASVRMALTRAKRVAYELIKPAVEVH